MVVIESTHASTGNCTHSSSNRTHTPHSSHSHPLYHSLPLSCPYFKNYLPPTKTTSLIAFSSLLSEIHTMSPNRPFHIPFQLLLLPPAHQLPLMNLKLFLSYHRAHSPYPIREKNNSWIRTHIYPSNALFTQGNSKREREREGEREREKKLLKYLNYIRFTVLCVLHTVTPEDAPHRIRNHREWNYIFIFGLMAFRWILRKF